MERSRSRLTVVGALIHVALAVAIGWPLSSYAGAAPWVGIVIASIALQINGWLATFAND